MAKRLTPRRRSFWAERLENRVLLSALVVPSPGWDVITLDVNPAGGVRTIVNGVQTDYAPGQWDSILVSLKDGVATDTLNVRSAVVPISSAGNPAALLVNVGGANGVQGIRAPLSFNRGTVTVDDTGDSAARTTVLSTNGSTTQEIAGLSPAPITIQNLHSLTLTTGSGSNEVQIQGTSTTLAALTASTGTGSATIDVSATSSTAPVQINLNTAASGADAVTVGNGLLSDVHGSIQITGKTAPASLVIDDSADPMTRGWRGLDGWVYFGPPTPADFPPALSIGFGSQGARLTVVNGAAGGNTISLEELQTQPLVLNTGPGDNIVQLPDGMAGVVSVNGDALGEGSTRLIVSGVNSSVYLGRGKVIQTTGAADTGIVNYSGVDTVELAGGSYAAAEDLGPISMIADSEVKSISFLAPQHLNSLTLNGGASSVVPGGRNELDVNSLGLSGAAKLDLTDSPLQVHYGSGSDPAAHVRSWLKSGQLLSSALAPGHALAEVDSADGVVSGLAAQTLLIRPALTGDANLDGKVDLADLALLARHYGQSNADWDIGDVNYDGKVGFDDLVSLARNYGASDTIAAGPVLVPDEPSTLLQPRRRRLPSS